MIMIILMIMDIQNGAFQTLITVFIVVAVAFDFNFTCRLYYENKQVLSMQD